MSAREGADVAEAYRNLTAAMIGFALRDADYLVEHVPIILDVLNGAGAPLPDLAAIMREARSGPEIPRSAEWTAAALRLAAWADGQATPEEPAPWDDPTAMSYEEIGDLVGL